MAFDLYPFKTQPYTYQLKVLEETAEKQAWALFLAMGVGKSKITIDNIGYLYTQGKIDAAVIIAPKGTYATWVYDQLPTHLPDCIRREVLLFSTARLKSKLGQEEYKKFLRPDKSRLRVLVINVEALITDSAETVLNMLFKTSAKVFLALDESTCVKHTDSKRSKEAYKWAAKAHYRRILTGTPVTNSPLDLWGQSLVLGRGVLGHNSLYSFRGDYAEMETMYLGQRAVKRVARYKNLDRLAKVLKTFSTQLTKEECLDLPEKVYSKVYIELTPEQERLYSKLRDEAMLELEGTQVEVIHVLTQLVKLHQLACGQLKLSETEYVSIPNNRVQALLDLVDGYPGKVIVWANYRQTLKDVSEALTKEYGKESVGVYMGGVSEQVRRSVVEKFQDPKDPLRFFVGNPQSGGYGLTLTQAQLCIFYSNSHNLEHRLQSEDRAHRIGTIDKVTYIDLVSKGTVDEKIIGALVAKKNLADLVMGNNWKDWL